MTLPGDERSTGVERVPEPSQPTVFADRVAAVLVGSEPGQVLTYGEVAAEAGHPSAARAVGRVLRAHGAALPWWRVVSAGGRLVPGLEAEHARRLEAEGVVLVEGRVPRS